MKSLAASLSKTQSAKPLQPTRQATEENEKSKREKLFSSGRMSLDASDIQLGFQETVRPYIQANDEKTAEEIVHLGQNSSQGSKLLELSSVVQQAIDELDDLEENPVEEYDEEKGQQMHQERRLSNSEE